MTTIFIWWHRLMLAWDTRQRRKAFAKLWMSRTAADRKDWIG